MLDDPPVGRPLERRRRRGRERPHDAAAVEAEDAEGSQPDRIAPGQSFARLLRLPASASIRYGFFAW